MGLGFKASTGPDAVEVPVDVELEQIGRIVARAARRLRAHAGEPGDLEIELIDEGFDEADGIVRTDVVIDHLGQQQLLGAIRAGNVRHGGSYHEAA